MRERLVDGTNESTSSSLEKETRSLLHLKKETGSELKKGTGSEQLTTRSSRREHSKRGACPLFQLLFLLALTSLAGAQPVDEEAESEENVPAIKERPKTPRRLTDIELMLGRPGSTELLWRVVERDLAYGLIDEAERHLKELLAKPDLDDAKILELREKYGPGLLVRLLRYPKLAEQAKPLVEKLKAASQAQAKDPERIRRFINKLDDSDSERGYALIQLGQAGPYAIPYFIEALRANTIEQSALIDGLLRLPREVWPAVAATLDSNDPGLMTIMIAVLDRCNVPRSADYLWQIAGNSKIDPVLRQSTVQLLKKLTSSQSLPHAVDALVRTADEYDRGLIDIGAPTDIVTVWRWSENNVVPAEMPVWQAQEFYGLRSIQHALELAPRNRQAKLVFLSLALDKSVRRVGIENELPVGANGALESALAAGPDLVVDVLERAMRSGRSTVALASVRALADTASPLLVNGDQSRPSPLIQALDYPNSRVRLSAALAALDIHPEGSIPQARQVVSALAQAIDPATSPKALILDSNLDRGNETGSVLRKMGYEPTAVATGRDGFKAAVESGLTELLVIDPAVQDGNLLETLANFDNDRRVRGVPTIVWLRDTIPQSTLNELRRYPNLAFLPPIDDPKKLAEAIDLVLPERTLAPWTAEERAANRTKSIEWIARIARGELDSLDPRPAIKPLVKLLGDPKEAPAAANALAFLIDPEVQSSLAISLADTSLDPAARSASARALAKNIQRGGNQLAREAVASISRSFDESSDPSLRRSIASVIGCLDTKGETAATRFRTYRPQSSEEASSEAPMTNPEPMPEAKEAEEEKENETEENESESSVEDKDSEEESADDEVK